MQALVVVIAPSVIARSHVGQPLCPARRSAPTAGSHPVSRRRRLRLTTLGSLPRLFHYLQYHLRSPDFCLVRLTQFHHLQQRHFLEQRRLDGAWVRAGLQRQQVPYRSAVAIRPHQSRLQPGPSRSTTETFCFGIAGIEGSKGGALSRGGFLPPLRADPCTTLLPRPSGRIDSTIALPKRHCPVVWREMRPAFRDHLL
jgi:hypothetical protein